MKVCWLTTTPLAGMPYRCAQVMNRFLEPEGGWARCIAARDGYGDGRVFPMDLKYPSDAARVAMEECDIFIVSAYMRDNIWRIDKLGKPVARHYSTEPFRWVEKKPDATRSTVVGQYQARFAEHLDVLPNPMTIDDPMYMPAEKPDDRIVVLYAPTSRVSYRTSGDKKWASKGYDETMNALRYVAAKNKDEVEVVVLERRPHEEVMKAKRHAHIVIDECATGSYHAAGLEGLSCGAVTVCWIDPKTESAFFRMWGEGDPDPELIPFHVSMLGPQGCRLRPNLQSLVSNPDLLGYLGSESRRWMETHYSERWQAEKWISWHNRFLKRCGKD